MTSKLTKIAFTIFISSLFLLRSALCVENKPLIIEDTKTFAGSAFRIQIPSSAAYGEAESRAAIDKAFKEAEVLTADKASVGTVIDKMALVLKGSGINNAFISTPEEMYSMGIKSDKEMWKAWIPHPTDKNKVYAILRLKDEAIVTVRNDSLSASVVAENAAGAEKAARDLLTQGADGIKLADSQGLDALLIIKDGKNFRTEMAGGFKAQYGKAKK